MTRKTYEVVDMKGNMIKNFSFNSKEVAEKTSKRIKQESIVKVTEW